MQSCIQASPLKCQVKSEFINEYGCYHITNFTHELVGNGQYCPLDDANVGTPSTIGGTSPSQMKGLQ